jgi:hypothetical protein
VTQSDPDGMHKIFLWIVEQPECDAATAAFIFHANNSFEALEYPNREATETAYIADQFQIAKTVAERWIRGGFRTRRFSFDSMGYEESLASYQQSAERARQRFGRPAFDIAPGLFEFRSGEDANSGYFYSEFQTLAEAYGPARKQ